MNELSAEERFWSKVDRLGGNGCWLWTASLSRGYGYFLQDGKSRPAHRVSYEWSVGPIPTGLVIDHLCRTRNCVNPSHMEPVTNRENVRRAAPYGTLGKGPRNKTQCPQGHPYDEANTAIRKGRRSGMTHRECKACRREQQARRRALAKGCE